MVVEGRWWCDVKQLNIAPRLAVVRLVGVLNPIVENRKQQIRHIDGKRPRYCPDHATPPWFATRLTESEREQPHT